MIAAIYVDGGIRDWLVDVRKVTIKEQLMRQDRSARDASSSCPRPTADDHIVKHCTNILIGKLEVEPRLYNLNRHIPETARIVMLLVAFTVQIHITVLRLAVMAAMSSKLHVRLQSEALLNLRHCQARASGNCCKPTLSHQDP